jgi:hypothetical protein
MRFTQIICTARNAAGEPKLAVLVATVLSVYNVTTEFTAVLSNPVKFEGEILIATTVV